MDNLSSIEYYSACPSCGATSGNKGVCEYCGASLIKKKTFRDNTANSLEEQFRIEDQFTPVFKGKSCNANPFLTIFCVIFGGCFLFVPIILLIVFISTGIMTAWIIPMLLLFMGIGAVSFVPLILSTVHRSKCKSAPVVQGIVRGYEDGSIIINGRPVQNVKILVNLPSGPKIALINLSESSRPYVVGSTIGIRNYQRYFVIEDDCCSFM